MASFFFVSLLMLKTKQMKAIKLFTLLLLLTSCTSNEILNICETEIEKVNKYFDGVIDNVKSKGYWQDEVIERLTKDRADALNKIKCD